MEGFVKGARVRDGGTATAQASLRGRVDAALSLATGLRSGTQALARSARKRRDALLLSPPAFRHVSTFTAKSAFSNQPPRRDQPGVWPSGLHCSDSFRRRLTIDYERTVDLFSRRLLHAV